jgi:hypothetical protein
MNATNDEDASMSRYVPNSGNSSKPRFRPETHVAIAAIDNLFLKHTDRIHHLA